MPLLGTFGLALAALAVFASTIVLFYLSFQKGSSGSRSVSTAREQQGGKGGKGQEKHTTPMERGSLILVGATALALTLCVAIIVICLLSGDNSLLYVAQNRSSSVAPLALLYKLSGLWAGREGSLLFWAWLISLFNAVVALRAGRRADRALDLAALAVAQLVLLVFLMLLLFDEASMPFVATPLEYLDANGALSGMASLWGMNTLLEHWAMAIHPPTLFVGYAGMTIPFAYAIATLITGDSSPAWIGRASRYTLVSWLFLGIGIGLGAVWAYAVLSWGGYWAWDPVENASLIPWLVASAYLHTAVIGSRRGKLQRVNVFLMALTTISAFFATYLVRTDVVQSLHAFGGSGIGAPLLIFTLAFLYLALFVTVCAPMPGESRPASLVQQSSFPALLVMLVAVGYSLYMQNAYTGLVVCLFIAMLVLSVLVGRSSRPGAKQLEGLTSKEGLLVLVSWLLLALACIILVATLWPVIIDALRGIAGSLPAVVAAKLPVKAMGLEPAFYNRTCLPLFALLGVLLLACPWRKWKNSGQKGLLSGFSQPLFFLCCLGGAALAALGLFLSGFRIPLAVMAISSSLAALAGIVLLFSTNSQLLAVRSTLAAHGVHIGLLLVILGVTFSGPYQTQKILELGLQQAGNVGSYRVFLNQLYEGESIRGSGNKPNYQFLEAELLVSDEDGDALGTLSPQRRIYANFEDQPPHAEVSTLFSLGNELYATLLTVDAKGKATLAVNVNPLINWIWIGSVLMCLFPFFGLARVKRLSDVRPDDANQGSVPHAPGA